MNRQVNNRFREYTVAIPASFSEEIRRLAKLNGVSEAAFIRDVVIKHVTKPADPLEDSPVVTLNGEPIGVLA